MKTKSAPTFNTWLLSDSSKSMTVAEWRKIGGCGLSGPTTQALSHRIGRRLLVENEVTLGELQTACVVAGREFSRFALQHLNMPEMVVPEYVNGLLA